MSATPEECSDTTVQIEGDGNWFSNNTITDCGCDGVRVTGSDTVVRENTIINSGRAAICVLNDGGTNMVSILEINLLNANGPAVAIGPNVNTVLVEDNIFQENYLDICDASGGGATTRIGTNDRDNTDPIVTACDAFA